MIDGLVCLYALVQALALTRARAAPDVALLRATGAETGAVATLLAGAALAVPLPAAVARASRSSASCSAPLVAHLAAGYADARRSRRAGRRCSSLARPAARSRWSAAAWVGAAQSCASRPSPGLREE